MAGSQQQPQATAPNGGPTGKWYFIITIASCGLLAAVPFFHAASVLHRQALRKLGAGYAVASIVGFTLIGVAPVDAEGAPTGVLGNLGGFLMLSIMVVATLQQIGLRQEVYGQSGTPVAKTENRSAIDRVEAARARRDEARMLVQRDPQMARELRIGRPDLPRDYDDGGLVDLNTTTAAAIAEVCQISVAAAEHLVSIREQIGGFGSVEEAIVYAEVSSGSGIRERGIVIPAERDH